jgi:hypothetical protein
VSLSMRSPPGLCLLWSGLALFAVACTPDLEQDGAGAAGDKGSQGTGEATGAGGAESSSAATSTGAGPTNDATQLCVDTINHYRATLGLAPYQRWVEKEVCASDQATQDSQSKTAHGAFGKCGESAQNECPDWPAPAESMITSCLAQMWAEGPGSDFSKHGHYLTMTSTTYTKVACGFSMAVNGRLWAVQDFQ